MGGSFSALQDACCPAAPLPAQRLAGSTLSAWAPRSRLSPMSLCLPPPTLLRPVQIYPYCDAVMGTLLTNLQSPDVHRSVKPQILSAFGDIALAIGDQFEVGGWVGGC